MLSMLKLDMLIRIIRYGVRFARHAVACTCQSASVPSGPMRLASSGSAAR